MGHNDRNDPHDCCLGIAGVAQVYLERKMGMDFLDVQEQLHVHFFGLILAATLFTAGVVAFIYQFIKSGLPTDANVDTDYV